MESTSKQRTAPLPETTALFARFAAQGAIDVTAFLGQWPTRYQSRATTADLAAMADRLRLQGMCVSHIASIHGHDTRSGNAALFAETAADNRLWPFVILNPAEPGWREELEWAASAGARGVRLLPGYHGYDPVSPEAVELIAAVRRRRLPLQVFVRLQDERLQHPRFAAEPVLLHQLAELIALTEGQPLLIGGLRENEWEEVKRHVPAGVRRDHVLCDLWYCNGPLAVIASLCARGDAGAFAYGSCTPIQTAEATALQLAAAHIREEHRYAMCRGNALRFIGMSESGGEDNGDLLFAEQNRSRKAQH
jgi:predicted TIM-barrel fold metal-dependent hydrolase